MGLFGASLIGKEGGEYSIIVGYMPSQPPNGSEILWTGIRTRIEDTMRTENAVEIASR